MNGHLILLLHAHLPYVRHPEYEYSLEENWLFEAIRETYIPMLDTLEGMVNDGISPNLTLSISPTLTEMLNDSLLRNRFIRYMDNLIELSEAEKKRTARSAFEPLASLYNTMFKQIKKLYLDRYKQDLVSAFRNLQDEGHIEIVASAATHAFLPVFENYLDAVKAQIEIGVKSYIHNFGRQPSGFWLPECGYFKGIDSLLKDVGIRYFFVESHGIIHGSPMPVYSIYKPVMSPTGIMVFGRDFKSAQQVWCASRGYPGDPSYRDFYRDIGFDLPLDYISRFTHLNMRTFTGIKYYRITGNTEYKLPYNRVNAMKTALEHAMHFIGSRESDIKRLLEFDFCPVIFSAFDAELFGHWWFEGIEWLNIMIRKIHQSSSFLDIITPGRYFSEHANFNDIQSIKLSPSSWGEGGYSSIWIGQRNHQFYRHLHKMIERMEILKNLATDHRLPATMMQRAINQAMREMLLAQASDWLFLIQKGRASEYAEYRIKKHVENFNSLFSMIMKGNLEEPLLRSMEESNNFLKDKIPMANSLLSF
ncbi:glycoside hydrolase [hot springs metagenome]|uniref:Glycoside hydrolase n=1 Tax=hot springs metagenome TaxID=433727 RepID=A0A5J4KYY8_9ZZZZ